jgi:hypothetical protein
MSGTAGYRATRVAWRPTLSANSALIVVAPGVALIGGWLIAAGHGNVVLAFCAVTAGLAVAKLWPGPFVALMVLVIMNGVPVVNLTRQLYGSFGIQDCAVVALAACLYRWRGVVLSARHSRVARAAAVWSACLAAWWFITFARSMLLDGIPVKYAASFGRDFLYFAILVPLAVRARLPAHSIRQGAYLLVAGVIIFALGQIVSVLSGHELSWLVHSLQSNKTSGQLRVYTYMTYLVSTALIFATAWLLTGPASRNRGRAIIIVAILGVSMILQLTRSNYAAITLALMTMLAVHVIRGGSFTAVTARIVMAVLSITVAIIAISISNVGTSSLSKVTSSVIERAESGITAVSRKNGTFGYRTNLDEQMLHILGSRWPAGLGFLDPNAHYVSGLPDGSIRNTDVGVFNALMTIGVIGAVLIYAPLLYAFVELLRAAGSSTRLGRLSERRWVAYGGAAWIAWALVGSWNLVVLFSVSGVVITAVAFGWLAQATSVPKRDLVGNTAGG